VQPGADRFRSQEVRRITAGLAPVSTTTLEPPLAQSAELQMWWPAAVTTTDTEVLLTVNRHGCPWARARTVNWGVAPA
jgi:hypothetical protein